MNAVANVVHLQFERGGSLEDIDKEIALRKQLVSIKSISRREVSLYHAQLGLALRSRSRLTGEIEDLNESCRTIYEGLTLVPNVPENHSIRRYCLNELASSFQLRSSSTGSLSDCN